jgi:hypothetical protein
MSLHAGIGKDNMVLGKTEEFQGYDLNCEYFGEGSGFRSNISCFI